VRPDLSDLVSGVQRLLQTEVLPHLPDGYLQEQTAYATLLLEYVKNAWSREHLAVAEEHADLARCLAALAEALGASAEHEARAVAAAASAALAAHGEAVADTPLDRVLAIDRERRAIVERAVAALDRSDAAGRGSDGARVAAAQAAIDAYLVGAAWRRDAALKLLGVSW